MYKYTSTYIKLSAVCKHAVINSLVLEYQQAIDVPSGNACYRDMASDSTLEEIVSIRRVTEIEFRNKNQF